LQTGSKSLTRARKLLEPINVLWIDHTASSQKEARDNVVTFLEDCDFAREGKELGLPTHSSGYYGYYEGGVWKQQYDPDDAWVERRVLGSAVSTNHGRIFPSLRVTSTTGLSVYFTSGAFSREGPLGSLGLGIECVVDVERCHEFRAFNEARDALNCGAGGWFVTGLVDFGNVYPLSLELSFSTADHDGVLVFAHP
jgi:hypothetical protein